jgi:hypothetical protein
MRTPAVLVTLVLAAAASIHVQTAAAPRAPGAAPRRAAAAAPARTPADTARPGSAKKESAMSFRLSSGAFAPLGAIPKRHTCDGEDLSPPLSWTGAPAGTKSFALVVDDPDAPDPAAPRMIWVHWVIYDLPVTATALPEGVATKDLPHGTLEGLNDWHKPGWRGPCPPVGRHRYFHRLYALDIVLPDLHRPTRAALEKAMAGHVLAKAELVGTYLSAR